MTEPDPAQSDPYAVPPSGGQPGYPPYGGQEGGPQPTPEGWYPGNQGAPYEQQYPGYPGPAGYGAAYPGPVPAPYGGQYPPGYDPTAPYGRAPTGEPYSDKQKLTAGLLQIFLGGFGAGRWYMGDTGIALAQLFTCGGLGVWALIDGIMMLTGNVKDKYGRPLRD